MSARLTFFIQLRASFTARNGIITQAEFELGDTLPEKDGKVNGSLINQRLHEIKSWTSLLPSPKLGRFLDEVFGMA